MPDAPAPGSHIIRVSDSIFLSLRQLDRQLEVLARRKVTRAETLRVALLCAENAEDAELIGYLEGSGTS